MRDWHYNYTKAFNTLEDCCAALNDSGFRANAWQTANGCLQEQIMVLGGNQSGPLLFEHAYINRHGGSFYLEMRYICMARIGGDA